MEIAAFFDIDGTLYREGFISDLFKYMINFELIPYSRWNEEVKPEYDKWDKRSGSYDLYLETMAKAIQDGIKGTHKSIFEQIVKNVINKKAQKTYVYTRDRIKWHRQHGHKIIAISGSPHMLVKKMGEIYGFDDFIGTKYVVENDIYTGDIIPMWDANSKRGSVKAYKEKYNIDLSKSFAYGDTAGDYSMFESVGNPYLINPTRELILKIKEDENLLNRSKVIIERKDVIYSINLKETEII